MLFHLPSNLLVTICILCVRQYATSFANVLFCRPVLQSQSTAATRIAAQKSSVSSTGAIRGLNYRGKLNTQAAEEILVVAMRTRSDPPIFTT